MIQIDNILQYNCKYHKLSILPQLFQAIFTQWAIVDGRWKVNLTRDAIKKLNPETLTIRDNTRSNM